MIREQKQYEKDIGVRCVYWDNIKFFLITLVVIGHFLEPFRGADYLWPRYVFSIIYTFHMPAFIFISGIFSKKMINARHFRIERIIAYILLYVGFKIIWSFLNYVLWSAPFQLDLFTEFGLAWYLLAVAIWLCITRVIKGIRPVIVIICSIILSFLVGFSSIDGNVLTIFRVINYWPFFLCGYYFDKEKIQAFLDNRFVRILGIAGLILFLILVKMNIDDYYQYIPLFTGKNSYEVIKSGWIDFCPIFRLFYFPYIFLVGICVFSIIPRYKIPGITLLGSRTLQVYYWHIIIRELLIYAGVFSTITGMFLEEKFWTLSLIGLAIVITMGLSVKIIGVPFNKMMKWRAPALFYNEE